MSAPIATTRIPALAIATVVFGSFALLLWRDYFHLHYTILGRLNSGVTDPVREQLRQLEDALYFSFRGLSVAAIVWCFMTWRSSEARLAVGISLLLTAVVVAINIWMFL